MNLKLLSAFALIVIVAMVIALSPSQPSGEFMAKLWGTKSGLAGASLSKTPVTPDDMGVLLLRETSGKIFLQVKYCNNAKSIFLKGKEEAVFLDRNGNIVKTVAIPEILPGACKTIIVDIQKAVFDGGSNTIYGGDHMTGGGMDCMYDLSNPIQSITYSNGQITTTKTPWPSGVKSVFGLQQYIKAGNMPFREE